MQHRIHQSLSYAEYRGTRYFNGLDGIRALCILGVITFHAAGTVLGVVNGSLGVMAFFVLSGYLITALCLREEEKSGAVCLKAFYVRRACRILPVYYVVVALYWAAAWALRDTQMKARFLEGLPYFLLHLNELAPVNVFGQSWSLGVEEKFYLLWPAIAFVVARRRPGLRISLAALFVIIPIAVGTLFGSFISPVAEGLATPREMFWDRGLPGYSMLMLGCLVACVLHSYSGFKLAKRLASPMVSASTIMILVASEVVTTCHGRLTTQSEVGYKLTFAVAFSLFMVPTVISRQRWVTVLDWKPLAYIGRRSYGMYLVHMLCLRGVQKLFPVNDTRAEAYHAAIVTILACAISLLASELLHRSVEEPLRKLGKGFADRAGASVAKRLTIENVMANTCSTNPLDIMRAPFGKEEASM